MSGANGAWIGWDGGSSGIPPSVPGTDIDLRAVHLERAEVSGYYHGFSNRTIWPLFHDLIQPPRLDRGWWGHYEHVNQRFAEETAELLRRASTPPVVWIHDYHLMLVPSLLRGLAPAPTVFFLHIPFPPPELFARLPWRDAILRGLLGADVVCFHTERYRKNFARTCGRILPDAKVKGSKIVLDNGREVTTAAHPISIDAEEFSSAARGDEVISEFQRLRRRFDKKTVLLGVDRLDYTKGIPERLEAFERLLERRADLRSHVVLVQIAVPSRSSVREYRELRERVEQSIGRINGRFTEPGDDVPVHYLHRGISRSRLIALYALADVMVVTALKDGMNLVAKEFVTCQAAVDGHGALLLSEFTGAALELKEAYPCNPFDVDGLSHDLERLLDRDRDASRRAVAAMARRVARNDVHGWARAVLGELEARPSARLPAEAYL